MGNYDENEEKIRDGIRRKLFVRPVPHDCFRRLSNEEKTFITKYAGFTDLEWKIFDCRCKSMSFEQISREIGYHPRYCQTISARIKKMISYLIQ